MRLWPYQMLDVLPRKQLLGQLRECVLIAVKIERDGHPNHILVNRIMDHDLEDFKVYCKMVVDEMFRRGYKVAEQTIRKLNIEDLMNMDVSDRKVFENWHNDRYIKQCVHNLEEKWDCGGITDEEWNRISNKFHYLL